jgi:hypothetical protein
MRTVKRRSLKLNKGKWEAIERLAQAFAQDKQAHLDFYQMNGNFAQAAGWRERRDAVKESDHHQKTPLPVHASDLAVKEAYETELKYWANIAEQIEVSGRDWTDGQKHYANWLLYDAQRFSALIEGRAPTNERISLTLEERKQVQSYLRRRARVIAAINQKARMNDREITLYTPRETVRIILVRRFEARLGTPECLEREDQDGDRSGADSRTRRAPEIKSRVNQRTKLSPANQQNRRR